MRRLLTYVITAPLVLLGVLMAHQGSYIAVAGHDQASLLLAQTGHDYMSHAPMGIGVGLAVLAIAMAFDTARATIAGLPATSLPLWPFAVAGPVAFFIQEHLERYLLDGQFPWGASVEATFILGLVLQAPAAFLTFGIAQRLMRSARSLASALARRIANYVKVVTPRPTWAVNGRPPSRRPTQVALRQTAPGRAPPVLICD